MRYLVLLLALSCFPKPAPPVPEHRKTAPGPLAPRAFQAPTISEGTLSNGVQVIVVENHEVPLVWVQLSVNRGGFTDPQDKPGLAMPGHAWPGQAWPGHAWPGLARPGLAWLGQAWPDQARPGHI